MTAAELRTAWDAGLTAGRAGEPATSCPYPPGPLRTLWLRALHRGMVAAATGT